MGSDDPVPEAIKGLVFHHPRINDHTLDNAHLASNCPLDIGRHVLNPTCDLGLFDSLPLELVTDIILHLDIETLFHLRRVNRRAMQVIDAIPQFQRIVRHNLATLRAILSIKVGSQTTFDNLYHTLASPNCEECNDFAGYIYLLGCRRVCFLCFTEHSKYLPLSGHEVMRSFAVHRSFLSSLPRRMLSVPGCYAPNERTRRARQTLFDREAARQACVAAHGSALAMERLVAERESKALEQYHDRVAQESAGVSRPKPRRPPNLVAWDGQSSDARRFVAIVRAPWVDPSTGSPVSGFYCVGCERETRRRPLHWRRRYTTEKFLEHLQQCGPIENGAHLPSRAMPLE